MLTLHDKLHMRLDTKKGEKHLYRLVKREREIRLERMYSRLGLLKIEIVAEKVKGKLYDRVVKLAML